jgi:insulysin
MILSFSGYNEKVHVLARRVAEKVRNFDPTAKPSRFADVQQKLLLKYMNFSKEAPYTHAMTDLAVATRNPRWDVSERLASLRDEPVTPEELAAFAPRLLQRLKTESLVLGNVTADVARDLVTAVVNTLRPRALFMSEMPSPRLVDLPIGRPFHYTGIEENENQPCGAICVYLQTGVASDLKGRVLLKLATHIIQEPAFDSLRTKQQLGYIVWTGEANDAGVCGLKCIVQSDKFVTATLDARIEGFLAQTMKTKLEEFTVEDLEQHKAALCNDLRMKAKTLNEESSRWWGEISTQRYFWNYRNVYADAIEAITMEELQAFYANFLAPGGAQRRKLSMRVEGHKAVASSDGEEEQEEKNDAVDSDVESEAPAELVVVSENIKNPAAFRRSMKLHPCQSEMSQDMC